MGTKNRIVSKKLDRILLDLWNGCDTTEKKLPVIVTIGKYLADNKLI